MGNYYSILESGKNDDRSIIDDNVDYKQDNNVKEWKGGDDFPRFKEFEKAVNVQPGQYDSFLNLYSEQEFSQFMYVFNNRQNQKKRDGSNLYDDDDLYVHTKQEMMDSEFRNNFLKTHNNNLPEYFVVIDHY